MPAGPVLDVGADVTCRSCHRRLQVIAQQNGVSVLWCPSCWRVWGWEPSS